MDTQPLLESEKNQTEEDYRLGGRSPVVTIFALLAGPLLSQLTNSLIGIVNTLWIEKGIGDEGLEVLTSMMIFDCFLYSLGCFINISASSHISYLFGKGTPEECNQLVADLMRIAILFAMICPAVAIPSSKPIVRWLTRSDRIAEDAFKYIIISSGCSIVTFFFYLLGGILQGEGRTWLFGGMQMLALVLDMACFLPLFVVHFRFGVWSAALSQIISQSIPTLILLIMLLSKKLTLDFKCKQLFRKFSKETSSAMKVGFVSFVLNFSESFPQFAQQKFITLVAEHVGMKDAVLAGWNIFGRLYMVACCIMVAFDSAYLPSASYAYGKKQYKRVLSLTWHTFWITGVWSTICTVIIVLWPVQLTSIFSKEEKVLKFAKDVLWLGFVSLPLYPIHSIFISWLQAVKRPTRATVLSVLTTLLPMPIICSTYYFTHPNSLRWSFAAYITNDISTTLVSIVGVAAPLFKMMRMNDGEDFSDEKNTEKKAAMVSTQSVESIADIEKE